MNTEKATPVKRIPAFIVTSPLIEAGKMEQIVKVMEQISPMVMRSDDPDPEKVLKAERGIAIIGAGKTGLRENEGIGRIGIIYPKALHDVMVENIINPELRQIDLIGVGEDEEFNTEHTDENGELCQYIPTPMEKILLPDFDMVKDRREKYLDFVNTTISMPNEYGRPLTAEQKEADRVRRYKNGLDQHLKTFGRTLEEEYKLVISRQSSLSKKMRETVIEAYESVNTPHAISSAQKGIKESTEALREG